MHISLFHDGPSKRELSLPVPVAVRDENRRSGVSKFLQEIKEQKNQQQENGKCTL